jgi:hypothetical protein
LCSLHQEALHVSLEVLPKLAGALEFLLQSLGIDAVPGAGDLDERPTRSGTGTEQNGEPNYSVDANDSDFDSAAVGHGGDNGRDSLFQKITVRCHTVQQNHFLWKGHWGEVTGESLDFGFWQGSQNSVFVCVREWFHVRLPLGPFRDLDAHANHPAKGGEYAN